MMKSQTIYQRLGDKKITGEELAEQAIKEPGLVGTLVDGMQESKAEVKYGCAKALRLVTDEEPELLYPYFDAFVAMLHHPNNIFRWQAIYVLGGLAAVDEDNKIPKVLDQYFAAIEGPVMITAANIVKGATRIALAKRELVDPIVAEILRVEKGKYEDAECYRIVGGTALKGFDKLYKYASNKEALRRFAETHVGSSRASTRKAAEKLLAKHQRTRKTAV